MVLLREDICRERTGLSCVSFLCVMEYNGFGILPIYSILFATRQLKEDNTFSKEGVSFSFVELSDKTQYENDERKSNYIAYLINFIFGFLSFIKKRSMMKKRHSHNVDVVCEVTLAAHFIFSFSVIILYEYDNRSYYLSISHTFSSFNIVFYTEDSMTRVA